MKVPKTTTTTIVHLHGLGFGDDAEVKASVRTSGEKTHGYQVTTDSVSVYLSREIVRALALLLEADEQDEADVRACYDGVPV